MRNRKQMICTPGLALSLCGCAHTNQPLASSQPPATQVKPKLESPRSYQFVHYETTGITSSVILHDSEIAILFTEKSDSVANKKLDALLHQGFYKDIELIGSLASKILWTLSARNMANSEPYQEFTLLACRLKKR